MSWKPAVDNDSEKNIKEDNDRYDSNKRIFDNMDRVDRRDRLGCITSFGGFGDSPLIKELKKREKINGT